MANEDAALPVGAGDFAAIRLCEREGCQWTVHNALVEPRDILMAMANHLQASHPAGAGGGKGGEAWQNLRQQFHLWMKNVQLFSMLLG